MRLKWLKRVDDICMKLDKFDVLTIKQLRNINAGDLGNTGDRNILRVMERLVKEGYVEKKRYGFNLYALRGRGFGNWEHKFMRNEYLIWKGVWNKARVEVPIIWKGREYLRADAHWVENGRDKFLEVDRRQKKKVNLEKIRKYKEIGAQFEVLTYRSRGRMWQGCVVVYIEDIVDI